jgi:hypothetical protein
MLKYSGIRRHVYSLCDAYTSKELPALLSRAVADEYIAWKLVALYSTAMKVVRTNPL